MAVANPLEAFVWGAGGSKKTPEQVAREREIAAALMQGGMDYSPVDHWLQGAARAAQGGVGALKDRWANEAEQEGIAAFEARPGFQRVFGGGAPVQTAAVDPVAEALMGTPQTASDATASVGGVPADWLNYANQGATRSLPLNDQLVNALGFLPELGVTMEVFSGGQPEAGAGQRVGSERHDHGNAADVFFYKDGQKLDWANPEHQPLFQEIVRRGKAAGITGFGAGDGYMQPGSMHLGFGPEAVWGAGGKGENAPDWLRTAFSGAPSGSPVQVAQAGGQPSIQELIGLSSDPWANDSQRQILQALMGQQMQQQDPRYQQQLRQGDLDFQRSSWEFDQARNAPPPLPGAPKTEKMFDPETGREQVMQWDAQQGTWVPLGGVEAESGPLVNINNLPETAVNDFFSNLGAQETANYKTILENGPKAARTLAQLDQLDGLLAASPQGFEAAATAFAGNFGIDLGNASGVQAAQALINQLVPAQRPPGSGPMSDADLELFKQSVPRIINQPGGNQIIMDTMRQINMYDQALANIVQEATWRGEMAASPEEKMQIRREMRDQIATLQNPLEQFGKRIEGYERPADEQDGTGTTSTGLKWSIVP